MLEIKLLLILIMANGVPILARWWLGNRLSKSIDAGFLLSDGYPVFGASKTWRGLFAGTASASLLASLLGFSFMFAIAFSLLSLLGDLFSSFSKRRLKMPSSTKFPGGDQIPEALLPLLFGVYWLDYTFMTAFVVTLSFFLVNMFTSPLLALLGIRKQHH